jgi:hypothetical protein
LNLVRYCVLERGSLFAARAEGACALAGWEPFESLVADEVEPDGQTGLTGSMRQIGPPTESADSAFTKTGASPPRIQTCESGGVLPNSEAMTPAAPGTCTFTT